MASLKETYFWIEFEETGGEISYSIDDRFPLTIHYSFDGSEWKSISKTTKSFSMGNNTIVYLENPSKILSRYVGEIIFPFHLSFNKNAKIGGDISSMTDMDDYCLYEFCRYNTYLTDASELILPWTSVYDYCFGYMFDGCTSLVNAPQLPATTLYKGCYYRMFERCTSLVNAPQLPATTLKTLCYGAMFYNCASLVNAPQLPATTLKTQCYSGMFYGCTSLIVAPELPATTLAENCYGNMFQGCTSLIVAPELPATTLIESCYSYMFDGCTSLTVAPELPATTLANYCYERMFIRCTNLKYIKMLAPNYNRAYFINWVSDVAPTGTFVKHPNNTAIPIDSVLGIPVGWTVYNEGDPNIPEPEIPTPPVDPDNPGGGGGEDPDNPNPPVDPDPDEPLEPEDGTIVSKTITIDNSAQDVEISVEQTNIALWTDVVIEAGDAYASLGVYDFTDSKITLEVNQNRSQTTRNIVIHIYAIDVNDNVVEGVITVVQDAYDEPIVPPEEITIPDIMLYKTRLDFPATGGSLSVQVDYRNATTINTPTCSQSWVSIRQSGGGGYYFEDDGSRVDQRMWIITMEETPFYRSAPIIFSCTNNVGTIFEEDKFMVYQTGPTTEDVEGDSYILVPKKEISLKEIGDSEEIIITYANVADIVTPEVPDGYEITEISRTQIDGNTIEVKYKITKIEDSKNDAKVIFKAQGKGGSEVKSDTTIKGWTPPTEPATVELPEIDLDNGVLVFEHTGGTREVRLTIDGYTKPMNVDATINDTNNNIHLVKNESDYDDGYDYCVWKLVFESEGNTTNNPYEGTIDVHYTDGLTDKTISFPFYVRYEGEGLIKEFSNNFKFDKDGELLSMSDNIGVGYLNIMTYHIPTHPDWIIIGTPTDGGVSVSYDKVYRYPISVQPNEGVERTGIVRISGIGKDGKEYYTDVTVTQEGTNTEVIIDEGFIELQSLSVTLPAEGGSETFQVKYYDLQELLEPEFVGDWATIVKVSETSEDGVAWNGEECVVTTVTYKVTANATTNGRQAKVIFKSYINYYDGGRLYMEKDKFRVNQLAPNATGTMGTVFAFSNNITVDSRGFAAGDTIWKEARVGYKDVTIEYPVIDVDWFRIAKIVDKGSSKEYDALKYYELEFDKNLAAFSRTGTITFKGKNEDGTYTTAIVRVVQLGEEPVDPETGLAHNYKGYFKSLDCTLYSVSLITQPGYDSYEEIILAGDSPVVVSYTESDRLYEPLRTSTCTIKVVSSSYLMNLYTGKAQGTQVVVKNEDTGEIEWCGFLQPNLYNQGFSAPVETIEFEASDCLNTLQYIDYSDVYSNGRFVVTFKEIIDDIMDRCKLINSYYVTQKMYSDTFQSKTMDFNNFYISEYNFYSEEEEPWKLKEVLEEICKYMGYVCFQWGDSVYFMDYDMYKEKKMNGARWDKSTRWNTKNVVLISEKANEIVADSYMGTGASMSLDDVFNSVKVNCNYYNVDDLIPDLFEDDYLTNRHGENAVISISRYGGRGNSILMNKTFYRVYDHKFINSLYYSPVTSTSLHETKVVPTEKQLKDRYFFREFIGGNIVDMVHLNYSEANENVGESKDLERYLLISQLNRPWCGAEGTFHWEDYNFPIMEYKNIPVIFIDNTAEDETNRTATRATTSSSRPNTRPQKKAPMPNYLVINASAAFVADLSAEYLSDTIVEGLGKKSSQSWYTYGGSSIDQVRNTPALCFYLEIPQAGWWNGSTWVDYKTHFEVRLDRFTDGTDDNKKYYEHMFGIEKDVFNTVETYLFLGTTGYRIPLPKVMDTTRDMYFAIAMPKRFVHCSDSYGGDNTGKVGNAYCFIKDLEMKIVNRNSIFYENDEDEVYENIVDSAFVTEGEEIDLKITSDNYKRFSYSTVSTRTAEDVPTTDIQFYNKNMELRKPEEAIIERYVNQYSTPSIKTSLTLDMSFKPYELITDTYWKKDFVITGQEIDYKNASQTITLLEKK
jgi:hypothetical protein